MIADCFYVIVAGSRTFEDYDLLCDKLNLMLRNYGNNVFIVSGGARGADTLAIRYAKEKGLPYKEFHADWKRYGKSAGYIRNSEMHKFISDKPNRGVILFWDGESKGTKQNIPLAEKYNTPYRVVNIGERMAKYEGRIPI